MFKFIYLIILLAILSFGLMARTRLDPHGKKNLKLHSINLRERKNSNCLICHEYRTKGNRLTRWKPVRGVEKKCSFCHNTMPHSGLKEHLGKNLRVLKIGLRGKINCLSCHRPHRANLIKVSKKNRVIEVANNDRTYIFHNSEVNKLPKGFINKRNTRPMLKRDCLDCHKVNRLP